MEKSLGATPARQGFYLAVLTDGSKVIAEWGAFEKSKKQWWQFVRDLPTQERRREPLHNVSDFESVSKTAVERYFECEPTTEILIERAYAQYQMQRLAYGEIPLPAPECRQLKIGDPVVLGLLKNAKVAALHDNGEVLTLEYDAVANREESSKKDYSTWHWIHLIKQEEFSTISLSKPSVYQNISFTSSELASLLRHTLLDGVRDDPDYQRGYVWTDQDKQSYLKSLFDGRDLGRFMFIKYPYPENKVVFDGKQRLSTLCDFYQSKLAYQGLFWHQLSKLDRLHLSGRELQVAVLDSNSFTREKLLEIFLDVNAGGVPQTEEHLTHVKHLLEIERNKGNVPK